MLLDRLHRGADGRADEAFLVVLRPGERGFARGVGAVDRRRHMALPQIVTLFIIYYFLFIFCITLIILSLFLFSLVFLFIMIFYYKFINSTVF